VRIGLFGGTFDPPHVGHLIAAQDVCASLSLDRFVFVPAAEPPHKRNRSVSPADVRLAMLEAAVAGNDAFEVSTIELNRSGPSFTVDTLRELHSKHGDDELHLVIGVDQVRDFGSWREPGQILELARLVMMTRNGEGSGAADAQFVHATVDVTRIDISSTLIRARVAAGQSIRYLVPDAVAAIIASEGLYK
jgi:nicotinate-nucleotide adenylyltransferase